ncbi:MAG: alpha/beta hydrolase [Bdellovibrio sp.]|nr:alpha/beta hydrolase [Bdellovibrio sp.]
MKITVTFTSQGRILEGGLFLPDKEQPEPTAALLFEGSVTGATSQVTEHLAREICKEGFVCMILDHSYYSDDESAPQPWESPAKRVEDIKAAMHFLQEQGTVDREKIIGVGVSVGAEYMARAIQQTDICQGLVMIEGPNDDSQNLIGHVEIPSIVIEEQHLESTVDQTVIWIRTLLNGQSTRAHRESVHWSAAE